MIYRRCGDNTRGSFIAEETLKPCPFCGSCKSVREIAGLYEFQCDVDSPCFGYSIKLFCMPQDYLTAVKHYNNRPLEIRSRMKALNEAAAVAGNWHGRRVDASYAIKSAILDLKRLECS